MMASPAIVRAAAISRAEDEALRALRRWSSVQERLHVAPYTEAGVGPSVDRKAETDAHNALRRSALELRRLEAAE